MKTSRHYHEAIGGVKIANIKDEHREICRCGATRVWSRGKSVAWNIGKWRKNARK